MEHQVFVPVPVELLAAALADPTRVAGAVPGLQQDAGAEAVAGRLKLRVGGHSVTYRGAVRVAAREDGTYTVEGDATEARGTGSVKVALTLRLAGTDGGCTVTVEGTADADGRITEFPAEAVTSAVTRLLNRFVEGLVTAAKPPLPEDAPEGSGRGPEPGTAPEPASAASTEPGPPTEPGPVPDTSPEPDSATSGVGPGPGPEPQTPSDDQVPAFGTALPPPSPDRAAGEEEAGEDGPGGAGGADEPSGAGDEVSGADEDTTATEGLAEDFADTGAPPAEAAHARRTMIGRSAEEVDHAPPRGRYAPVPAPRTVAGNPVLRWAAPAAALALASAIVVTRALRRRR
ncbi:SRPBCC family protein [Streptomyces sp. MUM 16J]|uniref:SRPBCC family protein n=1 Tax=Streptomyces sp. MUM 16J TaxID=2791988 RepID=UPI001F04664B|nr:SRPBCC family protein [Streptomyces sp. MUM 16J]MCH0559775.1 SRPBCC family protein [Streptomyces sp. MUM 16J]